MNMRKIEVRTSIVAMALFGMASVMTGCGGGGSSTSTPAPSVSAVSPVDGSTDNLTSSDFSVTFDVPMTVASITANTTDSSCTGSLQVSKDNFTSCVQMSVAPVASVGDTVFTITPKSGLSFSASYELKVTSAVTEATSNVAMASDYVSATGITTIAYGDDLYPIDGINDGFSFTELTGVNTYGQTMAKDSAGNTIIAGYDNSTKPRIFVSRYTSDGKLDVTFNTTGTYSELIGNASYIRGVAVDSQDRIVVVGRYVPTSTIYGGAFARRFNVDGTADTSFGTNGLVLMQNPSGGNDFDDGAGALVIDANDDIVMCGDGYVSPGYPLWIRKLKSTDGSIDTTFAAGGLVISDISVANRYNKCDLMQLDIDQNIVVAGNVTQSTDSTIVEGFIWRFTSAGVLDTSFNTTGYIKFVNQTGGNKELVQHIDFDSNDNIAATGYSMGADGLWNGFVARVTPTGALDTNFNTTGILLIDNPYQTDLHLVPRSLAVDSTDGIIIGAYVYTPAGDVSATIARIDSNGVLDTNYGSSEAVYDSTGFLTYNNIAGNAGSDILTDLYLDKISGQLTTCGYSMGANTFYGPVSMKLF